jgi:hypothetical protein
MRNSDQKRTWGFIVIGLLALIFIGLVIAYKYTHERLDRSPRDVACF